ncbi:MAG: hypothetical protein HFF64_03290 [Oscillospiraceae bacterium]|nr:hypothetical protein [Oscillospiraceae bacterium]
MSETYEWLYDNYAKDLLEQIAAGEKRLIEGTLRPMALTDGQKVELYDLLMDLRLRSGAEVFALGLQLGVRLTASPISFDADVVQQDLA